MTPPVQRTSKVTAVVGLGIFLFFLPKFYVRQDEVDIATGRHRHTASFVGIQLSELILDTTVSRVYHEFVSPYPQPNWRTANRFSGRSHVSPHYSHHGSLHAIRTVEEAMVMSVLTNEAKKMIVTTFLRLLQEDDDYFRASRYAKSVREMAWDRMGDSAPIKSKDLPSPAVKEQP